MSREPRRLREVLDRGQFAVTIEYNPPKGTNISGVLENAKQLVGRVHEFRALGFERIVRNWRALMYSTGVLSAFAFPGDDHAC